MKAKLICIALVLSVLKMEAQNAELIECNKDVTVKDYLQMIPNTVCIPPGYVISDVYEQTDVNRDGFKDVIFEWNKPELQDGDSIFVTIYAQTKDGSFIPFRTFSHLHPIYFKDYKEEYTPQDKHLKAIHKMYMGRYPLGKVYFERDIIRIRVKGEEKEEYMLTYQYIPSKKDWVYIKCELQEREPKRITKLDWSEDFGPTIQTFNYDYMDE